MNLLKNSLLARIGIIAILLMIILLGGLFIFLAQKVVEADNTAKTVTARLTSQNILDKIDRNFYERFGDVQAFAYNNLAVKSVSEGSSSPEMQGFINTMTTYYVLYDLMMLCDKQGKVIAVNTVDKDGKNIDSDSLVGKNYAGEEWFEACLYPATLQGAWYSDFMVNPEVGRIYHSSGYGMGFAAPVKDTLGAVTGVWYNFASWKEITESIHNETENELRKQDPNAMIILTKAEGTVIQSTDPSLILNKNLKTNNTDNPNEKVIFNTNMTYYGNFVSEWADSHGAYTYKAKNWKAVTLLTRSDISLTTFLSAKILPAIIFISSMIILLALGTFFYLRENIYKKIKVIQQALAQLKRGELIKIDTHFKTDDEFGRIVSSIGELTETVQSKAVFSDEIARGNLQADFEIVSEKDVLGISLVNMRNQLAQSNEENKKRSWNNEGLARLTEILRINNSMKELSENVLIYLVKYLKANQGNVFIAEKINNETVLTMQAFYAYERKKFLEKQILLGEGLAGQAYLEGEYIYLTEIPEHHISITSGLGKSRPRCILIMPLKNNEIIEGVIELASFTEFQEFEIEFVRAVAENTASVIGSVRSNEITRTLLNESKEQNEEMQAQEEEMRQNMEEMQATQEEMRRKDLEMSALMNVMNTSLAMIEFDMEGNVLSANENFLKTMQYSLEEIKSRHHRIFVEKNYAESSAYQHLWSELRKGKTLSDTFSGITKNKQSVPMKASYSPVFNNEGNPYKIIGVVFLQEN